jgi:N-acetylglucosamine kinase-like BadF-type ATPase
LVTATKRRLLALDGGKSKTVAELSVDGRVVATTRGPGLEILAAPGGREAVRAALADTLAALGGVQEVDAVCLGLNGVHPPSPDAEEVARILNSLVVTSRVVVASDMVTTYCGALGLTPGAVVAAGTGSIAMGLSADGTAARVDGWGYLLGDDGSGYAIGLQGLRSALRSIDGRDGSPALARYALERHGDPAAISRAVYASEVPARVIAGFSRAVAAAAHDGDPAAQRIWGDAGRDLARSAVAATRRAGTDTGAVVSWAGGLFDVGELLLSPFATEVRRLLPDAELRPPAGDAVTGARLLAGQDEPILTTVTIWR